MTGLKPLSLQKAKALNPMLRDVLEEASTVTLGDTDLNYILRRSNRRSVGLQISDRGLVVTAPIKLDHAELTRVLKDREIWIISRLRDWRQCQAKMTHLPILLEKELPLPIAGRPHKILFESSLKRNILNEHNQTITLRQGKPKSNNEFMLASQEIEQLLRKVAKSRFAKIANQVAEQRNIPPFSIHIASAKCRWGSCNLRGELRLNWRLMFYPDDIIKYVVVHEMAHLFEMNHSPKFWRQVEQLMPDYEKAHHFLNKMNPAKVPLV